MATQAPTDTYRKRRESFTAERDRLDRNIRRFMHGRMVTFLLGGVCLAGAWDSGGTLRWMLLVSGLFLLLAFVALVAVDSKTKAQRRYQEELRRVNEDAGRRLHREWNDLPELDYGSTPDHAYAADLDLFGHASLFQLLGTAGTIPGRETLRDWLLQPAELRVIRERQQAVAELAPMLDYRQQLEAHGRLIGRERPRTLKAFLGWTKKDDWILGRPALVWSARLLPIVTVLSFACDIAGVFNAPIWALSIGIGVLISLNTYAQMHAFFSLVASGDVSLRRYAPVFESASGAEFESSLLGSLHREMAPAAQHMRRLDRILSFAEVRYSGMLYSIVQMLFMWDHNVLCRLENWRRDAGPHVGSWVAALGQLEALAALAALAHAHPEWTFPEIAEEGESPRVEAKGLGHPLIRTEECVENDVTVGPPGTFLFVTGSNMSGKSTLLRSIGVNAVLAQAGGPVYATTMRLPLVAVFTSMRVSDSLDLGISQYMAQLSRLKLIVDAARYACEKEHQPQVLFLLDEILQGTNSAERLVAVRRIVRRLLDYEAIGAVTSHELTVPDVPQLAATADIVHFKETAKQTADGVTLSFDYRLRPGLSTSTNALKLMEMVGLE